MTPLLLPALLLASPAQGTQRELLAMGTRFSLRLEAGDARAASEAVLAELARIEAACSTWRPDSAWSRLNAAGGRALPLDPEWIRLLQASQDWSRRSGGAFDPVLMAGLKAWGIRGGRVETDASARRRAREASGAGLLELDPEKGTARLRHPEAGLEEGAFLKGYALDAARRGAEARRARSGLLDFGGQLLAWGRPVRASVAHPADRSLPWVRLQLRNASLSTSGCSERGRHILDPRTGEPCPAWGSASAVAASAFDADVLSTALYVLGPEEGLAWATREGVAALFLLNDGRALMSPRFKALHPSISSGALR